MSHTVHNLATFNADQIRVVEKAARDFMMLVSINPNYDLERGITTWRRNHPLTRGVSNIEIIREILSPGSFRETAT